MINFIDKTSTQDGTPINRVNLMAMQGFEASTTTFEEDNTIVEIDRNGNKLITRVTTPGEIAVDFMPKNSLTGVTKFISVTDDGFNEEVTAL